MLDITEGMNKGQLSDAISTTVASRRIDPLVEMLKAEIGA